MTARTWLRRYGDWVVALALVAGVAVETFVVGLDRGDVPEDSDAVRTVAAVVSALALAGAVAWRRRRPLAVLTLAIVAAACALTAPLDAPVSLVLATMIATYSVGAHTTMGAARLGLTGVLVLMAIAAAKDLGADVEPSDIALPVAAFGGPWLAGVAVRTRREREEALERAHAEAAIHAAADERARIARELHDAVAHAMGVMVLQARGARKTMTTDPDAARAALDAIEGTGTAALADMRRVVGVLRRSDDAVSLTPPPSLRQLDALVTGVREAGLPVEVGIEGTPRDLPPGVDLTAYRVVQEALTNTLVHAGPATSRVLLRYGDAALELEIADTGVGTPAGAARDGHGIAGMRERIESFDGSLDVGPGDHGGYVVRARLPFGSRAG